MADENDEDSRIHARDVPATVADRVNFIADMMERLEWVRGKSARRLAREWGIPVSTLVNYSAEASRRVTADADEVRREITARGVSMLRTAHENNQAKDFAALGKLLADVSGANAPAEHKITSTTMSPQEVTRLVREKFGAGAHPPPDEEDDEAKAETLPGDA
jgi:hypothetical protein